MSRFLTPAVHAANSITKNPATWSKTMIISLIGVLLTNVAFAQEPPAPPTTEADCTAAQGTWDDNTDPKCTLSPLVVAVSTASVADCCTTTDAQVEAALADKAECEALGNGAVWENCECKAPAGFEICEINGTLGVNTELKCAMQASDEKLRRERRQRLLLGEQLATERTERQAADTRLEGLIDTERTQRTEAMDALRTSIDTERTEREAAIEAERAARVAADAELKRDHDRLADDTYNVIAPAVQDLQERPQPVVEIGVVGSMFSGPSLTVPVAVIDPDTGDVTDETVNRTVSYPTSLGGGVHLGVGVANDHFMVAGFGQLARVSQKGDDRDGNPVGFGGNVWSFGAKGCGVIPNSPVCLGGYLGMNFHEMASSPILNRVSGRSGGGGALLDVQLFDSADENVPLRLMWTTRVGVDGVKLGATSGGQPFVTPVSAGFEANTGITLRFGH